MSRPESPVLLPNVVMAVDVVLFTLRPSEAPEDAWQVLLVQHLDPAFAGRWSLPGVLLQAHETFDQGVRRALAKGGLDARDWYIERLDLFGGEEVARDNRGRVYSQAHVALVQSDDLTIRPGAGVGEVAWKPVRALDPTSLVFDHGSMLQKAMARIQAKLRYTGVAFQLLPERFTLPQLRTVYAAILDPTLRFKNTSHIKRAFRDLLEQGVLIPAGERAERGGGAGRPGELYRFVGPVGTARDRELPWSRGGVA